METISVMDNPQGNTTEVHEDPYPSRIAMEAAVELEICAALGRVQTQTVGKVIQRAINKATADMLAALQQIAQIQREKCEHANADMLFMVLDNKVDIALAAIAKATAPTDTHRDSVNEQRADDK